MHHTKQIILVLLLVGTCCLLQSTFAYSSPIDWRKPWFCHNADCPIFNVLAKAKTYEIREYQQSKWVSVDVDTDNYLWAHMVGYYKLYKYFHGNNQEKAYMRMTAPVHTIYEKGKIGYKVSFYLPYEYQIGMDVPKPKDDAIKICTVPAMKFAVGEFGGYVYEEKQLKDQLVKLASDLDADDVRYAQEYPMSASYDNPFRIRGRHNEVWLILKDDSSSVKSVVCK